MQRREVAQRRVGGCVGKKGLVASDLPLEGDLRNAIEYLLPIPIMVSLLSVPIIQASSAARAQ